MPNCDAPCPIRDECKAEKLEEKFDGTCPLLYAIGFIYGRIDLRKKLEEKGQKMLE